MYLVVTAITINDPNNFDVKVLTDVDADSSTAFAVGRKKHTTGPEEGVIMKRIAGVSPSFDEVVVSPAITKCTVGVEANAVDPLTEVEVIDSDNVWVGGQCGRIWHLESGIFVERDSQTSAHVYGMWFLPDGSIGYVVTYRDKLIQSSILRYDD